MFFKRKSQQFKDSDAELSPEADKFLKAALEEFNAKQKVLQERWGFGTALNWGLEQEEGIFRLDFENNKQVQAAAQILGTYSEKDQEFEWAWNNPNVVRALKRDSREVRKIGKRLGIAYLQAGITPVAGEQGLSYYCSIGVKAAGSEGVYRGAAGPVDVIILLKELRLRGANQATAGI